MVLVIATFYFTFARTENTQIRNRNQPKISSNKSKYTKFPHQKCIADNNLNQINENHPPTFYGRT